MKPPEGGAIVAEVLACFNSSTENADLTLYELLGDFVIESPNPFSQKKHLIYSNSEVFASDLSDNKMLDFNQ